VESNSQHADNSDPRGKEWRERDFVRVQEWDGIEYQMPESEQLYYLT
jgi:hypothetical protein